MGNRIVTLVEKSPRAKHTILFSGVGIQTESEYLQNLDVRCFGTVGLYVKSTEGDPCALTCAHVIRHAFGPMFTNKTVYQPSAIYPLYLVGTAVRKIENAMHDVGLIRLDKRAPTDPAYREQAYNATWKRENPGDELAQIELKLPTTDVVKADARIMTLIAENEIVFKYGLTTLYTQGRILSYDGNNIIKVTSFNLQVPFARRGDSGSALVVKDTGEVIGIVYAVEDGETCFVHPVLKELAAIGATFVRTLSLAASVEDEEHIEDDDFDYENLKPNTKMLLSLKDALPELAYLNKIPGVVHLSCGMKITNCERTNQPALMIFVTKKYSEEELRSMGREILPKYVDSSYGRFPTDVLEDI